MKVLVLGSGGREHCLVWKLAQSPYVEKVYCIPGNGGTSIHGENIPLKLSDTDKIVHFVQEKDIDFTVVGPEAPLVEGIVDIFEKYNLRIFGPKKELAMLEGSKIFAKNIMKKYDIPTADFSIFEDSQEAKNYLRKKTFPLVIKADGLAAGKGVFVCKSKAEAEIAINKLMEEKIFGKSGDKIIVEEFLDGEEASILAFIDGNTIIPLIPSQDHKPVFDNDQGPNTGGMGAYAPAPLVNQEIFGKIMKKIFIPLMNGLKQEGKIFKGILYAGLMIKDSEPYVLEFNVRFGDPEIQAILPRLKTDLAQLIIATIEAKLENFSLDWEEKYCICVVLASKGYPGNYEKNKEIIGLEKIEGLPDIFVFHAGTKKLDGNKFVSSGGRVLNVVALGENLSAAQRKVYKAIENVYFEGMHYRKDIGNKALRWEAR